MMYAPHILQKKSMSITNDEFGRPIFGDESWTDVTICRCDDNMTQEFKSENGEVYRPKFHVVCEKCDIKAGDFVRCMDGESVRGEGEVYMVKNTNFFGYTEIWM